MTTSPEAPTRSSATIACGIPIPTIAGTNNVKMPVFIALEAMLIAAHMVLREAMEAAISC